MEMRLAEQLDIPLRDRNLLLHAAGYASVFPERPLDDPALRIAREAMDQVLAGHEPYPALAVDRHWTLIAANAATQRVIGDVDAALLKPPVNVMRLALHPAGMAPRTANLAERRAHLLARLGHQIQVSGDPVLIRRVRELRGYRPRRHGARSRCRCLRRAVQAAYAGRYSVFLQHHNSVRHSGRHDAVGTGVEWFYPADAATAEILQRPSA